MKKPLSLLGCIIIVALFPFIAYSQVTDIDGNVYKTEKRGTQMWMKENLKTTRLNDSSAIPLVKDRSVWENLRQPAYCWYNNDTTNRNLYGALYNWYAVGTGRLCPTGWHVPSERVFLAEAPFPCASRSFTGGFELFLKTGCIYWTSTDYSLTEAYTTIVLWDGSKVTRGHFLKNSGLPVRCIKN